MDQKIAVIHQHPFSVLVALNADRILAFFLEFLLDFVRDRLNLPRVCSGANDEVIRESRRFANVEDADVPGLL